METALPVVSVLSPVSAPDHRSTESEHQRIARLERLAKRQAERSRHFLATIQESEEVDG